MRDDRISLHGPDARAGTTGGYSVVIVTLDAHAAGPAARAAPRLQQDFPGIRITVLSAAEWAADPAALDRARAAVQGADLVVANLLFIEEHINAILPELQDARSRADAFVGIIADPQIVRLTRMGDLDMSQPASAAMALLRKLRGSKAPSGDRKSVV